MPDLKISQLPVASATTGAELFPVVQGGVTKQIALNAVRHIGSAVFDANGSMAVDTNTLFVDAVNNRVGVGTASPAGALSVLATNGFVGMNYGTSTSPQRGNIWYDTDGSGWHLSIGKVQGGAFTEQVRLLDTGVVSVPANNFGMGTTGPLARGHAVVADGSYSLAASGTTRGLRVEHNTVDTRIVGVDNTLTGSFQPLSLGGSTVLVRTNGSTLAATFDAPGNLGLGVTPSAWATANGQKALQITSLTALWTGANGAASLGFNAYESGVNAYTYSTTNPSSLYAQSSGEHRWFTAPSGTAGNAISFTQRLQVDGTTTAGQTALMLWDVDNGTLERVTVGAADSGGTGFKVLRIPN